MKKIPFILFLLFAKSVMALQILIPMDETQTNHLKAYGFTYWVLQQEIEAEWMLNYRGGSFSVVHVPILEKELKIRGISYQVISDAQYNAILQEIASPESNMDVLKLEKAPKIAVYSPKTKQPWDDAVTLVLTYAEIPYEIVYDDEIMSERLPKYDWLHLHHEDFTGQYGRFWSAYKNAEWYKREVAENENMAKKWGFNKVSKLKLAVAKKIRDFTLGGGFLFAMCSATDTYDIALAADNTDICDVMFDGDPMDPNAQNKLNFDNTFAFKNFQISRNPYEYEHSSIDNQPSERKGMKEGNDFFQLFEFSAKWDVIPTILTQNHEKNITGFMGQATGYKKELIKSEVVILGENKAINEARYIHGTTGKGTWTFYSGHDPEDYQHFVGEEPTDLNLHPNSPGFRLILNNILFPAAKKKKQKT